MNLVTAQISFLVRRLYCKFQAKSWFNGVLEQAVMVGLFHPPFAIFIEGFT
jgi:hypothetical protein